MTAGNNGNVTVWFNIVGTDTMDRIGSTRIEILENGRIVHTYFHTSTAGMMGSNRVFHAGNITYQGVIGRQYSAQVTFLAGRDGGSDTRNMRTGTVTARR